MGHLDERVPAAPRARRVGSWIRGVEMRGTPRGVRVRRDQLPDERHLDRVGPERVQGLERVHHALGGDIDQLVVVEQRRLLGGGRECVRRQRAGHRHDEAHRREDLSPTAHRAGMVERERVGRDNHQRWLTRARSAWSPQPPSVTLASCGAAAFVGRRVAEQTSGQQTS